MSETPRVALVTGANKGLGLETACQLGRLGFIVLLGVRILAQGDTAAAELRRQGIDARAVQLDVTSATDIAAVAAYLEREFAHLDVLANNAGVLLDQDWLVNRTSATPSEILRQTMEINFFAVVAVTQALLPLLRKAPAARIVNISSILGSLSLHATPGSPTYATKGFAYDTSKTALNSFTIHLAHELRHTAIKVNSAHPGWVKTDMGTDGASLEVHDGVETAITLATLPDYGPTGGFFHAGETIPW
jgi:NAD(P)-dependent dehydrogenase (short-subunit alcohol dehydrogenase family)